MSFLDAIRRALCGGSSDAEEHASRHDRRVAGRERNHETGEPAWQESDRIEDPAGSGRKNPDAAPEILGGN